jgi:DNA primase
MALFPQSFVDDLKAQTDIVQVITETVPLKKAGATWKGLCPFHGEKTPSFNVNKDKGFFKCFGCGVGGDVVKFVELQQKLSFPEAVRYLAQRAGIQVPEITSGSDDRAAAAERDAIVGLHEDAVAFYQEQLGDSAGAKARRELESRGLSSDTIKTFRYGYAPAGGRSTLHGWFNERKVPLALQLRSGLVSEYEGGRIVDRFRNRLTIPIARDTGRVVAFGARALDAGQQPKYLNSAETPVYVKGRTLYGLDVTKPAIQAQRYCVVVEGYFDLAQVWQAGVKNVVALCGTALTPAQAKILKRFTVKTVLNLDADAAGQSAAARSTDLLVAEGFSANVVVLPEGTDPDTFVRQAGAAAYMERLRASKPYFEFRLDRAAVRFNPARADSRKAFLDEMLAFAATIPDAAERDRFADRIAHRAGVTESVIRDEIRKAVAQRKTEAPAVAVANSVRLRDAEKGLIWALAHRPVEGLAALGQLEAADLEDLIAAPIFRLAQTMVDLPADVLPDLLRARLTEGERALFERGAGMDAASASTAECVDALHRMRCQRELAHVQEEIDRLQEQGLPGQDAELRALWDRKKTWHARLEALGG